MPLQVPAVRSHYVKTLHWIPLHPRLSDDEIFSILTSKPVSLKNLPGPKQPSQGRIILFLVFKKKKPRKSSKTDSSRY